MASMKDVADQLRRLEKDGRLDPADVVEAARDPASLLHSHFEWDDSEAARQHRLGQARQLIRRIKIEVMVRDVPIDVVRYVRDTEDGPGTYRDIMRVRDETDVARAAVIDEMVRVSKAVRRAKAVAAVLGVADDINRIGEMAATVTDQVSRAPVPPLAQ